MANKRWRGIKFESTRQLLSKYNGKRVVIIDDINDTGTTLKGIHDIVVMEGMTDNVKYVSLFEKLSSEFSVDIRAKELDEEEEKQWIVFPMRSGGNENGED